MGVHTATQLQSFLMDISDIEYTTEDCEYILEHKLLNKWLI